MKNWKEALVAGVAVLGLAIPGYIAYVNGSLNTVGVLVGGLVALAAVSVFGGFLAAVGTWIYRDIRTFFNHGNDFS